MTEGRLDCGGGGGGGQHTRTISSRIRVQCSFLQGEGG